MLLLGVSVSAQVPNRDVPVKLDDIEVKRIRSPEYSIDGINHKSGRREWLQVTVAYDHDEKWLDQLQINFYVLVKDESLRQEVPFRLFTASVTPVHISKGKHTESVYLHADVYERFGNPAYVAAEVLYGGKSAGAVSEPSSKKEWWKTPGFLKQDGVLLNRMQSPFKFMDIDVMPALSTGW